MAPLTARARRWGAVRYAGGTGPLTVRAYSDFYTHAIVSACGKMDVRFSITVRQHQSQRNLIEATTETDWTLIPAGWRATQRCPRPRRHPSRANPTPSRGGSSSAGSSLTPGCQPALFSTHSHHTLFTDREGDTLELEAEHRHDAEVENTIRDLKYASGLNHLPSGRFPANPEPAEGGAWLAAQSLPRTRYGVVSHNLARWTDQPRRGAGDHQNPAATLLLHGRAFHPQGALSCICHRVSPGKPSSAALWPACAPRHSLPSHPHPV